MERKASGCSSPSLLRRLPIRNSTQLRRSGVSTGTSAAGKSRHSWPTATSDEVAPIAAARSMAVRFQDLVDRNTPVNRNLIENIPAVDNFPNVGAPHRASQNHRRLLSLAHRCCQAYGQVGLVAHVWRPALLPGVGRAQLLWLAAASPYRRDSACTSPAMWRRNSAGATTSASVPSRMISTIKPGLVSARRVCPELRECRRPEAVEERTCGAMIKRVSMRSMGIRLSATAAAGADYRSYRILSTTNQG